LADALDVSPQHLVLGGVLRCYLDWLADQHASLDFHGLGVLHHRVGQLRAMSLEHLYVPTKVQKDQLGYHDLHEQEGPPPPGNSRDSTKTRKTHVVRSEQMEFEQAVRQHDRIVLLGGPGSGKTTLLRRLATACAAARHDSSRPGDATISPVFLPLAEYCRAAPPGQREQEHGLDPVEFVAACVRQDDNPDPESYLRERLQQGKCIVLLDGLDEVARADQVAELQSCLRAFLKRYPRNRFVITARQVGFDARPWQRVGFAIFHLSPWQGDQIRLFIEKWYAAGLQGAQGRARSDARNRTRQLHELIMANPRVRAIATNPLMLTILAALHHGGGALPPRRADLYGKIADALLESWEVAKSSARPGDFLHGAALEGREYGWLLGELALQMHRGGLAIAPRWWIADLVQRFLHEQLGFDPQRAKSEYDRVVRYLGERSGLFVERGHGMYAFWHATFQEYFAGRAILQQTSGQSPQNLVEGLRPHVHDPRWREVVRLVASQLPPARAPALLRAILDDPDPVGRFLHRGPLLALSCLSDGTVAADGELVEEIFSSVLDLGKSPWLGIAFEVLELLQGFAGSRLADRAQQTVDKLLKTAREHRSTQEVLQLRTVGDSQLQEQMAEVTASSGETRPQLGTAVTVHSSDGPVTQYYLDRQLKASRPEKWYARARQLLLAGETSERFQLILVAEIASALRTVPAAIDILVELLRSHAENSGAGNRVREQAACGLGRVAAEEPAVRAALLEHFENDEHDRMRRVCGLGLASVAGRDEDVRKRLIHALQSRQSAMTRAGAALGLGKSVGADDHARALVCRLLASDGEDELLRIACTLSLEPCLGEDDSVTDTSVALLGDDRFPLLQQYAAGALARALVAEAIEWDDQVVERVQRALMRAPRPGNPELSALRDLADAREVRAGVRADLG